MKVNRQKNLFWGLVAIAVALVLFLRALAVIPDAPYDLVTRGWPALLVLAGLSLLLRDRIPLGNVAALGLSVALTAGIIMFAYSARSSKASNAQELLISQDIAADPSLLLTVNITTLDTDVRISSAASPTTGIQGHFIGSTQSEISTEYQIDPATNTAQFTLIETKPGGLPRLTEVGRGSLVLDLPPDLALEVAFIGGSGNVTLDMTTLSLERLNVELQHGDAEIRLPEYQPRSPNATEQPGQLLIYDGDLTVFAPEAIDVRLAFDRKGNATAPQFPPTYIEVRDGVDGMLRRDQETAPIRFWYEVTIPNGLLSLQFLSAD